MFVRTPVLTQARPATQTHLDRRLASAALALLVAVNAGCLPDPYRDQARMLFDGLVRARVAFENPNTLDEGCNTVGEAQNRLLGEPGLAERGPSYTSLRDAAAALQAVCGQGTLLHDGTARTAASDAGRARWRAAMQHELDVACRHLRAAAPGIGREPPC